LLSSGGASEVRVDREGNGEKVFAKYSTFSMGDSSSNYMLNLAGFSGNAGGFYNYVYSHALMYNCMLMDRRQLDEVLEGLLLLHPIHRDESAMKLDLSPTHPATALINKQKKRLIHIRAEPAHPVTSPNLRG
jgi:hypothetical protein